MTVKSTRVSFISRVRSEAVILLKAVDELVALREQWDSGMNLWLVDASGSDPNAKGYDPGDFTGNAQGLMATDISVVIGSNLDSILTLLDTGIRTNLEKIRMS